MLSKAADRGTALVPEFGKYSANTVLMGGLPQHNLSTPMGLAFHPKFKGQLFVANYGSNSITIFFNPGGDTMNRPLIRSHLSPHRGGTPNKTAADQKFEWRQDNEACHFMGDVG